MTRKFVNPQGTFAQEVGISTNVGTLFFGPLALAVFGLWAHSAIWFLILILAFAMHPGAAVMAGLVLTFVYTYLADDLRCKKYLREGWREITYGASTEQEEQSDWLQSSETPHYDSETWRDVNTPLPHTAGQQKSKMKECPFCAEVIKANAIKCRYCGSDLPQISEDTLVDVHESPAAPVVTHVTDAQGARVLE